MAANYVKLETITVGEAGASSVTFNNIPQSGYTDLKIVASARSTGSSADNFDIKLNGLTTNFSEKYLLGAGSGTPSSGSQTITQIGIIVSSGQTANTFGNTEIYIPNYTSSNYKSISVDDVAENNGTTAWAGLWAGLWSSTAAITSVSLYAQSGNLAQYSTFSLYGLAAVGTTPVIAPYASGGDNIYTDGTYWIHEFITSGTFTPAKALSCDFLVIAGGGGGSRATASGYSGSGGGAGGYRTSVGTSGRGSSAESKLSLTSSTNYAVTVGAGGAGATSNNTNGAVGGNSVFSTITSLGGGYGAAYPNVGGAGGSGGGGTAYAGGSGTTAQGYDGTNNVSGSVAGAGGGAGAAPSAPNGGNGIASTITGSSVTRGGGGGAGAYQGSPTLESAGSGGTGGGGAGGTGSGVGGNGTPNTGGGGGGGEAGYTSGYVTNGGNGGSGIVIVRYAI